MIAQNQRVLDLVNPATHMDWLASRHFRATVEEWTPILEQRLEGETRALHFVNDLENLLKARIHELETFPELSRSSESLQCLANNTEFWETFDQYRATSDSLMDINTELREVEERRDAFDHQINSGCK